MDRLDPDLHAAPEFIGKVYTDGTLGNMVTMVCSHKQPILVEHKYWPCVLPDEAPLRSLRGEIQTGKAWNALLNATRQEPIGVPASLRRTSESYATLWRTIALTHPKPWLSGNV